MALFQCQAGHSLMQQLRGEASPRVTLSRASPSDMGEVGDVGLVPIGTRLALSLDVKGKRGYVGTCPPSTLP